MTGVALGGAAAGGFALLRGGDGALSPVGPSSAAVIAAERRRRLPGATVRELSLEAAPATVDLGGREVSTWAYNGMVPGPEVRVQAGEVLRVPLRNLLPDATTIHWHGIALRNDMDGVPGLTQPPIASGTEFVYEFAVPDPGTYFFHPHSGTQLDRGLYAPLVVDDPAEPGAYDREWTILLDDWTDGVGPSPDEVLESLRAGMAGGMEEPGEGEMGGTEGMEGMEGMEEPEERSDPLGTDTGDVRYPLYLLNGRPPADPATFRARPGERIRLRIINAGSDTAFRVALGGHRLTVTHTDGFPMEPVTVDAILLGMGERYDALVTVADAGAFPLVAWAEGKRASAMAVLRSGAGAAPMADARPAELDGRLLRPTELRAAAAVSFAAAEPDRTYPVPLEGEMATYRWWVNRGSTGGAEPLELVEGDRVRLILENRSMMWHPMHLHGHTFQVLNGSGQGPRKDTVIVPPMARVAIEVVGDNPGQWALHCHNIYHAEAGMQTVLSYVG